MDLFFEKNSHVPIFRQLCDQLRDAIINGRLKSGIKIPSSRLMQSELGLSRGTIRNVYEQLISEGYLVTKKGQGTFVSDFPNVKGNIDKVSPTKTEIQLSQRTRELAKIHYHPNVRTIRAFMPGVPDVREFPFKHWHRISKAIVQSHSDALDYSDPLGYLPLRQAISEHIHLTRAVMCDPEQVVICNGGEEALRLLGTLLTDPGDPVWVEEPCFVGRRLVLRSVGAHCVPVIIDESGFNVNQAIKQNPHVKLAYVVPSRNYPLGIKMSLPRRVELSEWAESSNSWIIEDDFDCEFRYQGYPVAPIYGIQKSNRVIYMSSFTTTLLPAFRLAFMVLPKSLLQPMRHLLSLGKPTSALTQSVLAEFIIQGYYASHIRRMRKLYSKRQQQLLALIDHNLVNSIQATDAGLNILVQLPEEINATEFSQKVLATHDMVTYRLSEYYMHKRISQAHRQTLVLGFACLTEKEIQYASENFNRTLKNWTT